jgi:mannosyltransferase
MTQTGSAPSRSVSPQALEWLLLLLIVCVGAFLRFHMLGVRSLWPPECFSFLVARQPFPLFLRTMWWGEANMAFYYLLLRGWTLLGDSEVWLQSLSALFGVLAIPAVYALGKRFLSSKVGLIAAALLAVNSSHIGHSEQLRSYSLWVFLAVLSTYCFLALLESPQRKILWLLYIFLAVLLIYAQVFGVFLLAAHWLAVATRIRTLGVWKILSTFTAIGILSAPMAVVMLTQNKGQLDWVPPVSLASFWEVFRNIVGTDVLGPHDIAATVALSVLYMAAWIVAIWGIFHTRDDQAGESGVTNPVTVLSWSLLFPLVTITALSFAKPVLYPRYLLMCLPAAVLLAGQGLSLIEQLVPRGRLVFSAALLVMIASAFVSARRFDAYLSRPGSDWRSVSHYILQHQEPGDAVIFYTFGGNWAWEYYTGRERETGNNATPPTPLFPLSFDRASITSRTAPYPRIWLVLQQDIPTPQSDANDALLVETMEEHFRQVEKREFEGNSLVQGLDASIHLSLYAASHARTSP